MPLAGLSKGLGQCAIVMVERYKRSRTPFQVPSFPSAMDSSAHGSKVADRWHLVHQGLDERTLSCQLPGRFHILYAMVKCDNMSASREGQENVGPEGQGSLRVTDTSSKRIHGIQRSVPYGALWHSRKRAFIQRVPSERGPLFRFGARPRDCCLLEA
jgi:hypothetical protein